MVDRLSLHQLIALDEHLSEEEKMVQDSVRRFVRERYLPRAKDLFADETFPEDLIPQIADMGLLGATMAGYGGAGMSQVAYGLALAELEYGDSGLRSFASVQGSLAMWPIHEYGSDAQKERFLPDMAAGKKIGCFGLTEPDSGSDPGSLTTHAKRDGDDWILNGTKMWITSSPICDLAVVWAKTGDDARSVRGFIVERGMDGFETPTVKGKMSLRASPTGEIVLTDVRVPNENVLPGVEGLKGPLSCLTQARFGIALGALGAARACLDAAIDYACERKQFGVPIAHKQLIQKQFADMATDIATGTITWLHFARLKDEHGRITPVQVSMCKRNNVRVALETARTCRSILGGNGILLEYPVIRHMLNLESVYTYEGTNEVHELILGHALTGLNAF
ncbi:MAG: acyl-CoA dehydrogenase family protein [Myxococcota bacterium]